MLNSHQLALDRRKQINTLLIFNENVFEVAANLEYNLGFVCGDGTASTLSVILPPQFPRSERPHIFVKSPPLTHPWLTEDGLVVGSPGLNSFGAHSDLGRVVQAIRRELERNAFKCQKNVEKKFTTTTVVPPVVVSKTIPEVSRLTEAELDDLKCDEVALRKFCQGLNNAAMEAIDTDLECAKKSVVEALEHNRGLCQSVEAKSKELAEKGERVQEAKCRVRQLSDQLKVYQDKYSGSSLKKQTEKASLEDEAASELCAEEFLAGRQKNLEQFVSDYLRLRSGHHAKKVCSDNFFHDHHHHHYN